MSGLISSPLALPSEPVLLGGENRSGTTLLSVVLDSHPGLVVGPEIDFTDPVDLGPHILAVCDMMDRRDPRLAGATKETVDPDWFDGAHFVVQCERFGLKRDDVRKLVTGLMAEHGTVLSSLDDRCRLIDSIGEFRREQTGAGRWGLKLQRRIKDIGTYAAIWPRAHFIHIIRDGRDLAASHLKTVPDWGYGTIAEAANGWLEVVNRPRQAAPDGRYLEVRYEDLVARPRETVERMLEHLGLSWDEAVLHHAEHEHALFDKPWGHPAAEAAGKPLHTGRRGRYLQDLTPTEIEEFERIAGKELNDLGYDLSMLDPGRVG
ncbi:sulfotransferase [Sinorhizobium sp. 7-81]|uniref:sulfotransferase family protein n=1 Tax=unclassified Sinorhizobium TaxID=2613772 RepID=UPI0024C42BB6|nr:MULTISPECIES: sulfotransferase [unclassified Sinorhizobium]MDK1389368.1 sulfotransferase [Sinorhizobium sp. 7-81]MDK1493011.1 sulfotransferase [Sinorhizobium sp. 8-89]